MRWEIASLAIALASSPAARAATYFASPSGSDSRAGTESEPFRTVAKAVSKARPGDTIVLKDGRYGKEGTVSDGTGCWRGCAAPVSISSAGDPGRWITLKAEHKWKAVLDCETGPNSPRGCDVYVYLQKSAAYWSFQDLVVTRGAFGGITTNDGASHIQILGCLFEYIGNVYSTSSIGITAIGFGQASTDWLIEGNVIHDIGRTGGLPRLNHDHGIYASGSNARIVNNVFYNNTKGWAIQTSHGTRDWLIANNTFAFSNPDFSGQIVLWDGDVPGSISGIAIRNNVFYDAGRSAVVTVVSSRTRTIPNCSIDHNVTNASSIYDEKRDCAITENKVGIDPNLVNAHQAPFDFHLREGSPAIGWGRQLSEAAYDFDGVRRSGRPGTDAGAYAARRAY